DLTAADGGARTEVAAGRTRLRPGRGPQGVSTPPRQARGPSAPQPRAACGQRSFLADRARSARAQRVPEHRHVASGAEPIRALVLMRGAFQRTAEGPPETRLPRLAAAHRARGQLAANGDRIPTVGAAELPFCMIAGGSELDFVAVGGSGQAFAGCVHPDPLDRRRMNLTTKMPILPPWRPRNPSLPPA